jgi:hypothetical protein
MLCCAACEVSVLETGGRLAGNLQSELETCMLHTSCSDALVMLR